MTKEISDKIAEMIISDDENLRELALNIALSDLNWVFSISKRIEDNKFLQVDFNKTSLKGSTQEGERIIRYFKYKGEYYDIIQTSIFRSMFYIRSITKEEYDANPLLHFR